jgi:hypothetical protein
MTAVNRLNNGEKIASASAILLFVLMFLDWFGVTSSDDSLQFFSVGRSAWEALDCIPIVLVAAIISPLFVVALRFMQISHKRSTSINAVVVVLGMASVLLISLRIIDPPSFGSLGTSFGTVTYEGTLQFPIFLALLAAAGIAVGGWLALREERGVIRSQDLHDHRDRS